MKKSEAFGVPEGLETTYDILGFPKYVFQADESMHNSIL